MFSLASTLSSFYVGLAGKAWPLCSLEEVGPLQLPDPGPAERHPQPDVQALHMLLSFNKVLTQRLV